MSFRMVPRGASYDKYFANYMRLNFSLFLKMRYRIRKRWTYLDSMKKTKILSDLWWNMKKKESDLVEDYWMFPGAPRLGDSDDEKDDFHRLFDDRSDTTISENEK